MFKNISLSEGLRLQFRGELFNAFNKVQFGGPNMNPNSPTYGCACGLAQPARTTQLGVKLIF